MLVTPPPPTDPTATRSTVLAEAILEDAAAGRRQLTEVTAENLLRGHAVLGDWGCHSVWETLVAVEHLDSAVRARLEALTGWAAA